MNIFKTLGNELSYEDALQLDGASAVAHINYNKSPEFNGVDSKTIATESRKNSLSSANNINNVIGSLSLFNGTEKNFKKVDRISLWKSYWLEYINAFDKLRIEQKFAKHSLYVIFGQEGIQNALPVFLQQFQII